MCLCGVAFKLSNAPDTMCALPHCLCSSGASCWSFASFYFAGEYVFGFGVLAMAVSTIIILMLINGFAFCEIANVPPRGGMFRFGTLVAGVVGFFGPILWGNYGAYLAIPLTEGFAVSVMPGGAYWVSWVLRTGALLWLAFESLRYWSLLRRRLRLGLADPLVTNRFLLLGIWALAVFDMGASDPLARSWYILQVGSTEQWIPELAHTIVLVVLALLAGLAVTPRPLIWLDGVTVAGGVAVLAALYASIDRLSANAPALARLRS